MVARHDDPARTVRRTATGVFSWWRRVLDGLVRSSLTAANNAPALTAGTVAVVIGAIGAGVLAGLDSGPLSGARVALALPLWAGIRLFVLLTVARHTSAIGRGAVVRAWGWSLIPFFAAVTTPLHAVAFLASAVVAWRVLEFQAVLRREAIRLVSWTYGFQLAVLLAAWLTRNLLLAGRIVLID